MNLFATIDMSAVISAVGDVATALTSSSVITAVIGGGLGVAAIFWGGKYVWRSFKGFTR